MDKATMNAPVNQSKNIRKKFDKTFKQHAVELWLSSGKAATEVAAELGIHSCDASPCAGVTGMC